MVKKFIVKSIIPSNVEVVTTYVIPSGPQRFEIIGKRMSPGNSSVTFHFPDGDVDGVIYAGGSNANKLLVDVSVPFIAIDLSEVEVTVTAGVISDGTSYP